MDYYKPAGLAHKLIFAGFVVLLFRTSSSGGAGSRPGSTSGARSRAAARRSSTSSSKDSSRFLVLAGSRVFFYYRRLNPLKRMHAALEGLLILRHHRHDDARGHDSTTARPSRSPHRSPYLCGATRGRRRRARPQSSAPRIATIIAPFHGAVVHAHVLVLAVAGGLVLGQAPPRPSRRGRSSSSRTSVLDATRRCRSSS